MTLLRNSYSASNSPTYATPNATVTVGDPPANTGAASYTDSTLPNHDSATCNRASSSNTRYSYHTPCRANVPTPGSNTRDTYYAPCSANVRAPMGGLDSARIDARQARAAFLSMDDLGFVF